jgi:hypothetical protein
MELQSEYELKKKMLVLLLLELIAGEIQLCNRLDRLLNGN